jgi:hypothetical protein
MFKIKVPIYECTVWIHYDVTDEEYSKWAKRKRFNVEPINCQAWCGSDLNHIIIKFNRDSYKKLSIVVHELYHATNRILQYIGANLNSESEECAAYLLDYLVTQFYKNIDD